MATYARYLAAAESGALGRSNVVFINGTIGWVIEKYLAHEHGVSTSQSGSWHLQTAQTEKDNQALVSGGHRKVQRGGNTYRRSFLIALHRTTRKRRGYDAMATH